jgi:hypothetical protein
MRALTVRLVLATLTLIACAREPSVRQPASPTAASYSDAFAYCRAVGTVDAPDSHLRSSVIWLSAA